MARLALSIVLAGAVLAAAGGPAGAGAGPARHDPDGDRPVTIVPRSGPAASPSAVAGGPARSAGGTQADGMPYDPERDRPVTILAREGSAGSVGERRDWDRDRPVTIAARGAAAETALAEGRRDPNRDRPVTIVSREGSAASPSVAMEAPGGSDGSVGGMPRDPRRDRPVTIRARPGPAENVVVRVLRDPDRDRPVTILAQGGGGVSLVAPGDVVVPPPRGPAPGAEAPSPARPPMPRRIVMDRDRDAARRADVVEAAADVAEAAGDVAAFVADGRPMVAIVLVDGGVVSMPDDSILSAIPVAVAVDPAMPDAARRAAAHGAAGRTVVLAGTGAPAGAAPQDVEVALAAAIRLLPDGIALLDLSGGGSGGRIALPALAEAGLGLLGGSRLSIALRAARRAGVAAAGAARVIDPAATDPAAIRRALDRAAFEAARDGAAVIVGPLDPAMLAALAAWRAQGRGAAVQVVPLSAVLARSG